MQNSALRMNNYYQKNGKGTIMTIIINVTSKICNDKQQGPLGIYTAGVHESYI